MDSIINLDSKGKPEKLTIITKDTLWSKDTLTRIDTTYFITIPLKKWSLESRNQANFTGIYRKNWIQGGGNIIGFLLQNNSIALYKRELLNWRTELEWRYGTQRQNNDPFLKTNDLFSLESQFNFRASHLWNYSGLFQFNTQLSKSYPSVSAQELNNYNSRFFSPARFTFSLGMSFNNKPNLITPNRSNPNIYSLFLSPASLRATYVMDTLLLERFSIPVGKHWLSTFGPMLRFNNLHRINDNLSAGSRLELFANMLNVYEPFVTVNWRINIDIRLSRYFSVGFETWLIYDPTELFVDTEKTDQICRKWQIQQRFMLNFTYRMTN